MAEGTPTQDDSGEPRISTRETALAFDPEAVAAQLPPTTDKRTLTRRAKQKQTRDRIQRERAVRINNENLIVAAVDSGATYEAIHQQTGMSTSNIGRIYLRAMHRAGFANAAEFKAMQHHRLGSLLMATWAGAQENDPHSQRQALRLIQEQNRLEGAYPAAGVDVTGDLTTHDVGIDRLAVAVMSLANQRTRRRDLAIEAFAVDELSVLTAQAIGIRTASSNGHAADTSALDDPT